MTSLLVDLEMSLAILLVAGHVIADFLLQTDRMVRQKDQWRVLLLHVGLVFCSHLLLVLPLVASRLSSWAVAVSFCALLAVSHGAIDRWKLARQQGSQSESLWLFTSDQLLHLVVILGVWFLWKPWVEPGPLVLHDLELTVGLATLLTVYVLNGNAAAVVIKLHLARYSVIEEAVTREGAKGKPTSLQSMGRVIGILERMILLSCVLLGRWEAIGWLFAGKTVARFRELDDRAFSEYYLIGTLSSLLFAAATGMGARVLLTGSL